MTTTLRPGTKPLSYIPVARATWGRSTPGMGGTMGSEPMAQITVSGRSRASSSGVTGAFSTTLTPYRAHSRSRVRA